MRFPLVQTFFEYVDYPPKQIKRQVKILSPYGSFAPTTRILIRQLTKRHFFHFRDIFALDEESTVAHRGGVFLISGWDNLRNYFNKKSTFLLAFTTHWAAARSLLYRDKVLYFHSPMTSAFVAMTNTCCPTKVFTSSPNPQEIHLSRNE